MPGVRQQTACPCGRNRDYAQCCGVFIDGGVPAPTSEQLMRSRYTAYVRSNEGYLLRTWHPTTRPERLDLASAEPVKWLGLEVIRCEGGGPVDEHGLVEFVARFKPAGRAGRLHETSRFVREDGRWWYVGGESGDSPAQGLIPPE